MANNYISDNQYKYYGAGSRSSDQVLVCFTCRNRGWPHEPIILAKAIGSGYLKYDYISGKPHIHKDRKGGIKVQQKSEAVDQDQERFNKVMETLISALDQLTSPAIEVSKRN